MKKNSTQRPAKACPKTSIPKASRRKPSYSLKLYVAGATARSQQAIVRARELCETELQGDYELEVIDIYQQPSLARDGQILATPTLVRELPTPVRRLIGNLSNTTGFFAGLELNIRGKMPL